MIHSDHKSGILLELLIMAVSKDGLQEGLWNFMMSQGLLVIGFGSVDTLDIETLAKEDSRIQRKQTKLNLLRR